MRGEEEGREKGHAITDTDLQHQVTPVKRENQKYICNTKRLYINNK